MRNWSLFVVDGDLSGRASVVHSTEVSREITCRSTLGSSKLYVPMSIQKGNKCQKICLYFIILSYFLLHHDTKANHMHMYKSMDNKNMMHTYRKQHVVEKESY